MPAFSAALKKVTWNGRIERRKTRQGNDAALPADCGAGREEAETPFGAVISRHGEVVTESANRVVRDNDVTRHAELIAISEAQRLLGSIRLPGCTLYSIVEPCAMCSFPIRETRIERVVFSLRSPFMGGFFRWDVLRDERVSVAMPEMFGRPPEIISDVLAVEAEKVWHDWNPLAWRVIKHRGCFRMGQVSDQSVDTAALSEAASQKVDVNQHP